MRSRPATRAIPVFLYTALTGRIAHLNGLEAGADDFLAKPFRIQELVVRVDKLLHLRVAKTAAAASDLEKSG